MSHLKVDSSAGHRDLSRGVFIHSIGHDKSVE